MSGAFTLNLLFKGVPQEIHCLLRVSAYTYQILCKFENGEIILEKDDQGNLRALGSDPFSVKNQKPDPALVKILIEEMERILQ